MTALAQSVLQEESGIMQHSLMVINCNLLARLGNIETQVGFECIQGS
jgi:hypothetical protein